MFHVLNRIFHYNQVIKSNQEFQSIQYVAAYSFTIFEENDRLLEKVYNDLCPTSMAVMFSFSKTRLH